MTFSGELQLDQEPHITPPSFELRTFIEYTALWGALDEAQREMACYLPLVILPNGSNKDSAFFAEHLEETSGFPQAVCLELLQHFKMMGIIVEKDYHYFLHPGFELFLFSGPLFNWKNKSSEV